MRLVTNVEDEAILNVTDVVLCANFMDNPKNGRRRTLKDDFCVVIPEGDIASIRQKQNKGIELSKMDKNILKEHYFEHCSSEYREKYQQHSVTVEMKLVNAPNQCKSALAQNIEALNQVGEYDRIIAITGFTITAIGFLGAILSLSVFCRPSFLARHHVGYLCIGRSVFDILMLIFCAQSGFGKFLYNSDQVESYGASNLRILRCGMFFVFFLFPEIGTMLFTLAISVQRLMAVAMPLKAKVYLNKKVDKKICIAVVCVSLAIPAICFVSMFFATDNYSTCILMDEEEEFMYYFSIIWLAVFIALPWVTIIISTVLTLYYTVVARNRRNEMTSANSDTSSHLELHKEDFVMVISITFSFLIALTPEILFLVLNLTADIVDTDIMLSRLHIEFGVFITLAVKCSLPFFIFLGSNSEFRQMILGYIKLC